MEHQEEGEDHAMVPIQRVHARCNQGSLIVFWDSGWETLEWGTVMHDATPEE